MSKEVNEERTPRTVADVKEMLTKHSNGEIQRTIQNCITILQNDHVLADAIRLNLLSERIDIVKPVGWPRSGKTLNDTDMKYILRRMEKYGISSEKKIESAIRIVANENRYHPTRDYLNSLKWDGTERIAHVLHHFLGAAEDEYTCEAMKIFLLGAIKRVFQPGCKFETMLCLVGGQGAGKSSFFRLLAVKDECATFHLRPDLLPDKGQNSHYTFLFPISDGAESFLQTFSASVPANARKPYEDGAVLHVCPGRATLNNRSRDQYAAKYIRLSIRFPA